jgi:uncharacterized membrane protein YhaH (DUF805 family)
MDWYLMVWKKYAQFSGRSRRKEYWMFQLFNILIILVLGSFLAGLGLATVHALGIGQDYSRQALDKEALIMQVMRIPLWAYVLAAIIPAWACGVRRLHDIGARGWWLLVSLVPLIGLILIVFLATDSEPGTNKYGPNPKLPEQTPAAS